jgi:3'-phosphoadenosine 5'-phosphosulfate sulfotransferase (PAPS reductase)/FAD synthetase
VTLYDLSCDGFDLSHLGVTEGPSAAPIQDPPDLDSYDMALIATSGGKDSLAMVLHLLEQGFPREKIELHHSQVDGREGSTLMDWPCTEAYCDAVADALGLAMTYSWRRGGIEAELLRKNASTAPMMVPAEGGGHMSVGGRGPLGTRRKFPQLSADLSVRWCSSSAKISLMDAYIRNHPKFFGKRTLVMTGERAEESRARANYARFEPHRSDTRGSKKVPRHVDVWRSVHSWSEARVWDIIGRWKLQPHPAYLLGWGRLSCRACVFGSKNQWASVRAIAPEQFNLIANYEREFKVTIHRSKSVMEQADAGAPYPFNPKWVEAANSKTWSLPIFVDPWVLPAGRLWRSRRSYLMTTKSCRPTRGRPFSCFRGCSQPVPARQVCYS